LSVAPSCAATAVAPKNRTLSTEELPPPPRKLLFRILRELNIVFLFFLLDLFAGVFGLFSRGDIDEYRKRQGANTKNKQHYSIAVVHHFPYPKNTTALSLTFPKKNHWS
jgi:hypothetical protein